MQKKSYTTQFSKALLPLALLGSIVNSSAQAYELIDLGANVTPKAINNFGVVVGSNNTNQYFGTFQEINPHFCRL